MCLYTYIYIYIIQMYTLYHSTTLRLARLRSGCVLSNISFIFAHYAPDSDQILCHLCALCAIPDYNLFVQLRTGDCCQLLGPLLMPTKTFLHYPSVGQVTSSGDVRCDVICIYIYIYIYSCIYIHVYIEHI